MSNDSRPYARLTGLAHVLINGGETVPKKSITSSDAPGPKGGYSPAVVVNGLVFTSGQAAFDAQTDTILTDDVAEQTVKTIDNLEAVLAAAGADLSCIAKTTVHLADIGTFHAFDQAYRQRMPKPLPARTTVASDLAPNVLVEIDAVATVPEDDPK